MRCLPLLLCASLPGSALAGGLESAVPADAWAFFGCDDVEKTRADFEAGSLGRLLRDPSMDSMRAALLSGIDRFRATATEQAGADPIEILEWIEGGAAVVVFDCATPDPNFFSGFSPIPRIGFLLEGGANANAIASRVRELIRPEIEAGRGVVGARQFGDVEVTVVTEAPSPEEAIAQPSAQLSYCVVGGTFLLTIQPDVEGDREEIDSLIAGVKGELEAPLAKAQDYRSSLAASAPDDSGLRAWFDAGRVVRQALDAMSAEADEIDPSSTAIARSLGVDRLGAFAARWRTDASGSQGAFELPLVPGTPLGRILNKFFPAGTFVTTSKLPAEGSLCGAFHLDLASGIEAVLAFLDEAQPEAAEQARMTLEFMSTPEFDPRRDVLAPLGDEIGFVYARIDDELAALPGTEDDPSSVALLVELDDSETLAKTIEGFVAGQGLAAVAETGEVEGRKWTSIPTPLGLKVWYSVLPDLLVIAASEELMVDVLRRVGEHQLSSLATDESFVRALAAEGEGPWTLVSASDAASGLVSQFETLVGAFEAAGLEPGMTSLDADTARKFTSGRALSISRVGDEGFFLSHSHREPTK